MKRSALVAAVVLPVAGASILACASILGIEDAQREQGTGEAGIAICSADSGIQVDSSQLFVAFDIGDDDHGCTMQSPCKSIGAALKQLSGPVGQSYHLIYVSSVTQLGADNLPVPYAGSISLPAGIEIQGGWYATGSNPSVRWQQICDATNESQTANILGTDNIAIHAEKLNGFATLTNLVVRTKAAAAGESVYGIFLGSTAKITLKGVRIETGNGGDGTAGSTGTDGNPGTSTCTNPGTGAVGSDGDAGTPAPVTVFNATGAVTANGTSGADGMFGSNGAIGPDGGCVSCVTCMVPGCGNAGDTRCGSGGAAGCAGAGGGGGGAGQSGGSSIGIFAWGGFVSLSGGVVHAGKGGTGGPGGAGGKGGVGSDGAEGAATTSCDTSCLNLGVTCPSNGSAAGSAGGSGTAGGKGGNGGTGASGAGGDSVAIVSGLDASVLTDGGDSVDIAAGGAGTPGGISQARYP